MAAVRQSFRTLARRYIAHRQRLGYAMRDATWVHEFARFIDRAAPGKPLTTALALEWVTQSPARQADSHARRLGTIRCFARYCAVLDPRTEVPPQRLLGPNRCRFKPHLYTPAQVRLILRRARQTSPHCSPLAPQTYATLLGLIASTGLRLGETLRLRVGDFDARAGTLLVPRAKFSPQRLLPLHPTVVRALRRYDEARRRIYPLAELFFVTRRARPLSKHVVEAHFRKLVHGIRGNGYRPRPRIHDFRHTFATRIIARWSRAGAPVAHSLMLLCRYLGHQGLSETWWYISADSRALAAASKTFAGYRPRKTTSTHEHLVPPTAATLLCRTPDHPAEPQPQHDRGVSRYVPPAPRFPRSILAQAS